MIDQIQNGEIGSSVRTKLNSVIDIANRAGVQLLASGSVDLNTSADQPFTLSGGSKFAVTDVVMANGSGTFNSAGNPYLYTAPSQGGVLVAQGAGGFMLGGSIAALLQSPDNYINYGAYLDGHDGIEIGTNGIQPTTVGNTLYYSNTPNGDAATADIYIYGYILA